MRRPFSLRQDGPMPEAVIVSTARTPIGRAAKGSLVDARPDDLCAFAIRTALERVPELPQEEIVDVIVGCGFPEAKQGMNLGRRVALLAGLPETVPGTTVNRFCASSLQAIRMAFHAIRAGEGEAFVAAGVESISQVSGYPKSEEEIHPALFGDDAPIANVYIPMGLTAENVAERWDVSREEMDRSRSSRRSARWQRRSPGSSTREMTPYEGVAARRRPARVVDIREARLARSRVQARRQGDGRELVPAERRRGRGGRHVGRPGERARPPAAGADHRVERFAVSSRRSWASGRSRPSARCSRRPT